MNMKQKRGLSQRSGSDAGMAKPSLKTISPKYDLVNEYHDQIEAKTFVQQPAGLGDAKLTSLVQTTEDEASQREVPSSWRQMGSQSEREALGAQTTADMQQQHTASTQGTAQMGLSRQSSYQKMLTKYNEKKERMQRPQAPPSRPADLPTRPASRLHAQRGPSAGGHDRQPQYLTYLEKTLEKSDLTIQSVKQMNTQFSALERKVDNLQNLAYNHDDLYTKIKVLEDVQINQHEENNLSKLIIETMQAKIRDQELANEALYQQINSFRNDPTRQSESLANQQAIHDSQMMMHQALQGLETKIEEVVAQRLAENAYGSGGANNQTWARREQTIMELVDAQGKDIAVDIAKMEQQMQQLQSLMLAQQQNVRAEPATAPGMDFSLLEQKMIDMVNNQMQSIKREASPAQTRSLSPSRVQPVYPQDQDIKYLRNKVDQFENHLSDLTIQVKRQRLDKLTQSQKSQSRSRSRTKIESEIGQKDLKAVETRLSRRWTTQLTSVVDKLGKLIKKQEGRIVKLQKAVKQINRRESERESLVLDQRGSREPTAGASLNQTKQYHASDFYSRTDTGQQNSRPQAPQQQQLRPTTDQRTTRATAIQRQERAKNANTSNYRTFSPILSSTSRSVRNLMDKIQENVSDFGAKKAGNQKASQSRDRLSRKRSESNKRQRKFSPLDTSTGLRHTANIKIENTSLSQKGRHRSLSNTMQPEEQAKARIVSNTKDKIVNGRLLSNSASGPESRKRSRSKSTKAKTPAIKSKKSRTVAKSSFQKSAQMSFMSQRSKALLAASRGSATDVKSYERQTQSSKRRAMVKQQTESSELAIADATYKSIRLRDSGGYQYDRRQEAGLSAEASSKKSRGQSDAGGKLSASYLYQDNQASPYKRAREQLESPDGRSPGPVAASSRSSPYVRSTKQQSNRSISRKSRSPFKEFSAAKIQMPTYIEAHPTSDKSLSQSPSRKRQNVSNQKDVQIMRDNRGFKRKIEYLDDSASEDDLAYSKSILQSRALRGVKQDTPKFEERVQAPAARSKYPVQSPLSMTELLGKDTPQKSDPNLHTSTKSTGAGKGLQQSSASTALDRSMQMRATNDRLAKLEQMYEELSLLEAKATTQKTNASAIR